MKRTQLPAHHAIVACLAAGCLAADWNQWRGPSRDGVDPSAERLVEHLPDDGLQPQWISETIPAGGNGGWASPVVASGKVYIFAHYQTPKPGVELPQPEYPVLSDEQRRKLSKTELDTYEQKRQAEEVARRKASHDFTETVYCFDARTGETVWKNDRASRFTSFFHSGTPAVVDGKLYVLAAGPAARCLDAKSGQPVWETALPSGSEDQCYMSSFAVVDGVAVVLAGQLVGLDAGNGQLLWKGGPNTTGSHSSPAVWRPSIENAAARIIVNVGGQDTICIDPANGNELWRITSGADLSTPLVVGDRLLTYGDERQEGLRLFDLSATGAELAWTCNAVADKGSSPVVVDEFVYVQGGKRLVCVDLKSGKPAWTGRLTLNNPQYTSLVAADGKIYYAYDGLSWFKADPSEYKLLESAKIDSSGLLASSDTFRALLDLDEQSQQADQALHEHLAGHGPLDCASPALADGHLYLRTSTGLICYDLRVPSLRTADTRSQR